MGEKNEKKDVDSDVEDVTIPDGPIELSDDNNDDEICEPEHLRKLFVGGLAGQTDEETLRKFYRKWGTVVDTVVMRDSTTKRSRGFGFVTYSKVAMVDKAQSNRPHIIDGRTVESKRALPRPENQPAEPKKGPSVKKLFVGGLKDLHDEKCLKEYFSEFGNVLSVQILVDNNTGKRRGFALVEYDDYDAVDKAILKKTHMVSSVLLDVKRTVYVQETKKKFTDKTQERNRKNDRIDGEAKGGSYRNRMPPRPNQGENHATASSNMMPRGPPIPPQAAPYQQGPQPYQQPQTYQPTQSYQQPQQQYSQMPSYQQGPPPNYNQWGPPPPPQPHTPYPQPPTSYPQHPSPAVTQQQRPLQPMPPQNYAGYGQTANAAPTPSHPPPPQTPNWNNYAAAANANTWSAPLPPPQPPAAVQAPASNWQNNQWGPPPSVVPPTPMPPGNHAPLNWQQSPAVHNVGPPPQQQPTGPGMYQQPQQQQLPPPPPPPPNMFGSGYQQNYGGGPTKQPSVYTNRMNPYGPPSNQYNNNPPPPGYGNGMPNVNRYRR